MVRQITDHFRYGRPRLRRRGLEYGKVLEFKSCQTKPQPVEIDPEVKEFCEWWQGFTEQMYERYGTRLTLLGGEEGG